MDDGGSRLAGLVAIVTGSTRGIGKSIAWKLAGEGASVVISSRKEEACREVAEEIGATTGAEVASIPCHVGDWAQCDALVAQTMSRFGSVGLLVNNAGMSPLYPSLTEISEELFWKVMAVNLGGAFRLSTLVGSHMQQGTGGTILNISSVSALKPQSHDLPYACAKAGLDAMTEGLARSFGPTVRVNSILPGMFETDVSKHWDQEETDTMLRTSTAAERLGDPNEIAELVAFLASSGCRYLTGSRIKVDGGLAYG
ncbi:SDR family NAD(P)-dependent oxidoreductase [Dietzia maris]